MAYNPIHGTAGNDRIDGTSDDDHIVGGGGNDFLIGWDGDDWLEGGEDGDRLAGMNGDDLLEGGNGNDFLQGFAGDDALYGQAGNDYLQGHGGTNILAGGAGIDRIGYFWSSTGVVVSLAAAGPQATGASLDTISGIENLSGSRHDDVLTGNEGANVLWGSGGNDIMLGLGGDDLFGLTAGTQFVDGGEGTDTLGFANPNDASGALTLSLLLQGSAQDSGIGQWTLSGIENLVGGFHDDRLVGDGGDNVLAGFLGADTLVGNGGDDILLGDGYISMNASPPYYGSGPVATWEVNEPGGDDVLEGGLGNDRLVGGSGSDTARYSGASGSVTVNLFAGAAFGADGHDTLESIENVVGSAHADLIIGNNEENRIEGLDGDDTLLGFGGDDVIDGGAGRDYVEGAAGADMLYGGDGDDYLYGNQGDDLLHGGGGFDRAGFSLGATKGVTVDLTLAGIAQDTGQGWDTLIGIENVSGTIFDDVLTGNDGDNYLWGGSDGSGVTGNDTISGGGGNDVIEVGAGNHRLHGGEGIDTLHVYGNSTDITPAGVTVTLQLQGMSQDTEQGMMWVEGFENVSGSIHDDNLAGDDGDNVIAGYHGADHLVGGAGNDTLLGDGTFAMDHRGTQLSGPAIRIDDGGGAGDDMLFGGAGDDILVGGGGRDLLTGGEGEDLFRFLDLADSSVDAPDLITDFNFRQDRIDFSSLLPEGVEVSYARDGFSGEAGEIVLEGNRSDGSLLLQLDADGDGAADLALEMAETARIPPGWFDRVFGQESDKGGHGLETAARHVADQFDLPLPHADIFVA